MKIYLVEFLVDGVGTPFAECHRCSNENFVGFRHQIYRHPGEALRSVDRMKRRLGIKARVVEFDEIGVVE